MTRSLVQPLREIEKARSGWRMPVAISALAALGLAVAGVAMADSDPQPPSAPVPAQSLEAGQKAFADVFRVLQSPRCMNCHPSGDAPLQTDKSRPHAMSISRLSSKSGLACSACHQQRNSEAIGIKGGPPGAPHWGLPPEKVPMVFQSRTPRQLCEQLNDPNQTGGRDLAALLHHVERDALVLWAWDPGGTRTKPPLSHRQFTDAFRIWVGSGGACP